MRGWYERLNMPLRAPEGGGDGGGTPDGGGAPDGGGQADPGGGDGGRPSPEAYRPDGLPDHLAGESDQATIDKIFKAYDGFRRAESERGAVPKDAAGYKFEPAEPVGEFFGDLSEDEMFKGVMEDAHKAGLTDKQVNGFLNSVFARMIDTGKLERPIRFAEELGKLLPEDAKDLDEAGQKSAISRRIQNNLSWLDGAKAQGMPEDVADHLSLMLGDTAIGQRAIEWIRDQSKGVQPALDGQGGSGGKTEKDFDDLLADKRSDPGHPQHVEWQKEKTALAKQIWGTGPAGGARA